MKPKERRLIKPLDERIEEGLDEAVNALEELDS